MDKPLTPADWTLQTLEAAMPQIAWREPLAVTYQDGSTHYACRVCIARVGLHGRDVPRLPTSADAVKVHIRVAHT